MQIIVPRRIFLGVLKRPVLSVFCLALAIRLGTILLVEQLPPGTFALDDSTYSGMAKDIAQQTRGGWDAYAHQLYRATFSFVAPLAIIYSLFGVFSPVGEVYVALLGAGVAAGVTFTATRFMAPVWAVLAGAAVAFLPSQVLWSSLLLKDPAVWLGLAALAATASVASRSSSGRSLGISAVVASAFLFYLAFLREHTLVVAAWSLPLAMIFSSRHLRLHRLAGATALMLGIPWIVGIGPAGWALIIDGGSLEARRAANAQHAASSFIDDEPPASSAPPEQIESIQKELESKRKKLAELESEGPTEEAERVRKEVAETEARLKEFMGGPDSESQASSESLDPNLAHLPKGLSVMLFEPVPWSTEGSSTMRMARLESLLWYPLLALASIGLLRSRRLLWALAFPILAGGGMLIVYALTEGNIGTAYRHRGEFVWVVCLLAGLGASQIAIWKAKRRLDTEGEP